MFSPLCIRSSLTREKTIMGGIIATNRTRIERDAHILTPYHRLAESPASARNTILIHRRSWPITAMVSMTCHRHFFAAFLAFNAVLAEMLVITLGNLPFTSGRTQRDLLTCLHLSMTALTVMCCCMVAKMVWRRKTPDLPRAPDTILSVMSYVADSHMLDDFEGCEVLESKKNREQDFRIREEIQIWAIRRGRRTD